MNNQVECISDFYSQLTKGKIYEVIYEFADCIVVSNDLGYRKKYPIDAFRKLTNEVEDNSMNKNNDIERYNQFAEKRRKEITDKINPSYYGTGLDVIDFCQKNNLDFMQGNVIKYVTRYKEKNGKEDLLKAKEYIDRIIKENYKED